MQLAESTWPEVEAYLQVSRAIILPIGSTEQHGPNGLIGTDWLCPSLVAESVGERTGLLVAPALSYGIAQHHLGFPGSVALTPSTLIRVLLDVIQSFERHGFRHVYLLNGHGGNIATVNAAFAEYYGAVSLARDAQGSDVHCYLRNWWSGSRVQRFSAEHYGDSEGSHATPTEVSLTFHAFPARENRDRLKPEVAPRGVFRDAVDYRHSFPDGRIGSNPALASAEDGAKILRCAVDDTVDHLRTVFPDDLPEG